MTSLTSTSSNNLVFTRYSASGIYETSWQLDGTGWPSVNEIQFDQDSNLVLVGSKDSSPMDFDPGPGTLMLSGNGTSEAFLATYSLDGTLVWAQSLGGSGPDSITGLALDAAGNLVVAGNFVPWGIGVDFDPSAATAIGSSGSNYASGFVAQYSPSGSFMWVQIIGSDTGSGAADVAVSPDQSVSVGGSFLGTVGFDPGPTTANLTTLNPSIPNSYVLRLGTPVPVATTTTSTTSTTTPAAPTPSTTTLPVTATPEAIDLSTSGPGVQHVEVSVPTGATITLVDPNGTPSNQVTIAGTGTFTLNPATNTITFSPVEGFQGDATVGYRVTDPSGVTADATYTARVRGITQRAPTSKRPPVALAATGVDTNARRWLGMSMTVAGLVLWGYGRRRVR